MTVQDFYNTLEKYKTDTTVGRYNHCYLIYIREGKSHVFQVRSWKEPEEDSLVLNVVNWTVCAGPAILYITESNINSFAIVPDQSEVYKLKSLINGDI